MESYRKEASIGRRRRNRANGEGWITKRADGKGYNVGLHVYLPDGTKKRRETTRKTKAEADRWLTKQKSDRDEGIVVSSENPTVHEYASVWLEQAVRGYVSSSTYKQYRGVVKNHIVPDIGTVKIKALTARRIQQLYAKERDAGLKVGTRQHTHTILKKMLTQAVRWGDLPRNPAEFVDRPNGEVETSSSSYDDIRPYTETDLEAIFAAADGNRFEALYKFAPGSGLREQELLALSWEDLVLPRSGSGRVRVKQAVIETENGFAIGPTKNKKSRRTVEFPENLVRVMECHRERQLEQSSVKPKWASRPWEDNGLVFPNAYGALMNRYRLGRYFRAVRDASGVGDHHQFKDFRHTFATLMFSRGKHPKVVQEMMGHSSIKITMDIYSHWIEGAYGDAGETLGDLF